MSQFQVVLAPAWGRRWSGPGLANEAIARRIARLVAGRSDEFFILAQQEVSDALRSEQIVSDHTVCYPPSVFYLTTKQVFSEMLEIVRHYGFYRDFQYCLVSHPLHTLRARRTLVELGIPEAQLFSLECEEVYDPGSIHPWTWSKTSYVFYEHLYYLYAKFLPK